MPTKKKPAKKKEIVYDTAGAVDFIKEKCPKYSRKAIKDIIDAVFEYIKPMPDESADED